MFASKWNILLFNYGTVTQSGAGIPMATDIALFGYIIIIVKYSNFTQYFFNCISSY